MSASSSPFGFIPADHPTGHARAYPYTIASAYGTALYKYNPVILNTNGTITAGTTAADLLGIFAGVEYTDSTGKPTWSNYWPASTTATNITAYVWADPEIVYNVQANGSIAQTAIGDQADVVNPTTGSTSTGLGSSALNSTLAGAGSQGQFRIIGFNGDPGNAVGDAYTVVQVQLARSQFVANKVAI
jgi:hypothetical protein